LQKKGIMVQKEKYQQFNAEYYNQGKFLDVVTKRKINKHLSDINDVITEDDIKNVKTDIGISISIAEATTILRQGNLSEEPMPTTWNILES
jgi:hypothetical protein